MLSSDFQKSFGNAKRDSLPDYCRACDVRFACHGECPKNRFIQTPDGQDGLNYLCAGYKAFFHHIDEPMRAIARLIAQGKPAEDVMALYAPAPPPKMNAGRNDPCPCGSGIKFKRCHGAGAQPIQS